MTELETFKQEVAHWLEENCPASMRKPIISEEMVWGSSKLQFQSEDQKLWFERMRDRGWFAPSWPREYGGGGLSPKEARILETEMARLGCRQPQYNLGVWMLGPVLVEVGTHEQKLEHLVPMMRGEQRWCQGFSEPNAGSDLASLKTSARRVTDEQGEAYIVNGGKIWTSDGDKGDWMYALVRTSSEGKKQDGISFLLIDMKSPGVTVKPIELISGKSSFCQVFFDDVRVPMHSLSAKRAKAGLWPRSCCSTSVPPCPSSPKAVHLRTMRSRQRCPIWSMSRAKSTNLCCVTSWQLCSWTPRLLHLRIAE